MTTIRAEETRLPRRAREAVERRESVVVVSHGRPTYVIVHPDEFPEPRRRRGRRLGEALRLLGSGATPDPGFGDDMEAVRAAVGSMPDDPWAR
ncbi:hypothetical protein HGA13_10740 [Nocardia speluncae]|uniref:Antitoxin n=1 Tax=Nocardia speluncae TaxID=419477 RepID=A0A846XDT2_9NOCA|nr:hypothetical protein [Nocardia speluncae]NKY33547.1 hypothetical protein [Nocardia speluncae]